MLLFQDGSTHRWIAALGRDLDLIVTLDDATGAICSELLVEQEGTMSSLLGLAETITRHGLFRPIRGCSGRCRSGCRRSCASPGSRPWRRPTATSGNASCPTTTPASRCRPPSPAPPSCPMPAGRSRTAVPTIACPSTAAASRSRRHHYVRATVRVHHYPDGSLAIFDGLRCLARFNPNGEPNDAVSQAA
jgi:hypothetical protein